MFFKRSGNMDTFYLPNPKLTIGSFIVKLMLVALLLESQTTAYNSMTEIENTITGAYEEVSEEVTDDNIFFDTTTIIGDNNLAEDVTTVSPSTSEEEYLESIRRPIRNCECGIPRLKYFQGATRVIGGQPALEGEFPWFGVITKFQHNKHPRWRAVCGAALINGEFAITAAHCLHNRFKDTLEVVFNVRDVNNITSDPSVIRRKIKKFLIHPEYNPETQDNDIALIRFKIPINLRTETSVVPICLPEKMNHVKNGTFAGFGHTNYGSGSPGPKENSRVLIKVDLPILTHEECLRSKVPTKKNVTESMVCAGSQGKDACINDSGGPLMTRYNGKTVIVGLASWGIGCALPDYPGVYTRVSKYLNWIKLTASSDGVPKILCEKTT